jgi:HK97 family phage prohead protease
MEVAKMAKRNLPNINEVAKRSYGILDLRAEDEGSYIEGHPAVYDQKVDIGGWFYEVIERGAFSECDFDDVLFSVNHNLEMIPLARSRRNNINSTMQIGLDDTGVKIKANLDIENNAEAKSLYSSVKRGDIDGMSFIFYIRDAWWENLDTDMPTRHITKIRKVKEVSAVTFPAYSDTDINARDQEAVDTARTVLDNARSGLDNSKNELEILKLRTQIKLKG